MLPLVGEWVPARDDGRKWRWSLAAVGGENGVGEEKGEKERVFGGSDGGERRSCRRF